MDSSYKGLITEEVWDAYCKSDVILVGLNGTFTTMKGYGGIKGFSKNFYSIALSKSLGKKVVIYAASIEPFSNHFWEKVGKYIINHVDLITLREMGSLQYLKLKVKH